MAHKLYNFIFTFFLRLLLLLFHLRVPWTNVQILLKLAVWARVCVCVWICARCFDFVLRFELKSRKQVRNFLFFLCVLAFSYATHFNSKSILRCRAHTHTLFNFICATAPKQQKKKTKNTTICIFRFETKKLLKHCWFFNGVQICVVATKHG